MSELIALDVPKARQLLQMTMDDTSVDLGWSACGRWLAAATTSGVVHVVDAATGALHTQWLAHETGALSLCWHPRQALLASGGQDSLVRLWQVTEASAAALVGEAAIGDKPVNGWVEHLAWRPDGEQLAAACGSVICLLASDGSRETVHNFPGGTVGALCWRPKGAQLAVGGYGGVRIYNVLDPDSKPQDLSWKGSLLSLSWSPDGQVIAAGCQDNTVHFWRLPVKRDAMMSGFDYKPLQLSWSTNSRWLLTGGSAQLILWPFDKQGPEGRSPLTREFHRAAVCAISIAQSGQRLATGCRAGQIAFWKQLGDPTPEFVADLDSRVEQLSWSPHKHSRQLASTSRLGVLNLWEAAPAIQ